jgi:glycosyltransferase involved in cell wall biosynthesis
VTAVLNGVDLDRFRPPLPAAGSAGGEGGTVDLDALAGLPPAPPGTVRVGLVATLARWKGHEVFLRALARLAEGPAGGGEAPPVRGYVIGGALYATGGSQTSAAELRELAGRLGLGDRVGFTGFVPDAAAALGALDVAVHASTEPEPFGLAIAEAMASGRAVVVSAAGGAAELIEDGVDALAHPPGDHAALAARIAELAADPGLRRRLGAAARATAERRFDRRRAAAGVIEVWERALAAARGTAEAG